MTPNDLDSSPLMLDELTLDPELVHLFSSRLASRFHTLPVAKAGGRITVVIADPEDLEARNAIETTLGRTPYFVRGDQAKIDALIHMLYPNLAQASQYILALGDHARLDTLERCARDIGIALQIKDIRQKPIDEGDLISLAHSADYGRCRLVIVEFPERKLLQRILRGSVEISFLRRLPISCLITQGQWTSFETPLLILHGDSSDMIALEWVIKLAYLQPAHVTAVLVLPQVPGMYDGLEKMRYSIPELLHQESMLGRNLRQVMQRLQDHHVKGDLFLKQGIRAWEIRRFLESRRFDLMITAYRPAGRLQRQIQEETLIQMLGWSDRPMLIAK